MLQEKGSVKIKLTSFISNSEPVRSIYREEINGLITMP
jgi:hypothetical protein